MIHEMLLKQFSTNNWCFICDSLSLIESNHFVFSVDDRIQFLLLQLETAIQSLNSTELNAILSSPKNKPLFDGFRETEKLMAEILRHMNSPEYVTQHVS